MPGSSQAAPRGQPRGFLGRPLHHHHSPAGARAALDEVAGTVAAHCGIASNLGKTRAIAAEAIPAPPGIAELGDEVWRGDKPEAQRGVVVLGTPLGHPAFVQAWAEDRMRLERQLLDHLPHLPDLQCAWLLLLMCASPRANHAIRTLPPSESVAYARMHDEAIWATLCDCLGGVGEEDASHAHGIASLPAALGGLGLQSAERTAPAAYWAAWADALVPLRDGLPEWADRYTELLEAGGGHATCLQEAAEARQTLQGEGWTDCPTWRAVLEGQGAPAAGETSAGERPHGWQ